MLGGRPSAPSPIPRLSCSSAAKARRDLGEGANKVRKKVLRNEKVTSPIPDPSTPAAKAQ